MQGAWGRGPQPGDLGVAPPINGYKDKRRQ